MLSRTGWQLQKPKCGEAVFSFCWCSCQILRQKTPMWVLTRNSSYDRTLLFWKDRNNQLHALRFSWRSCDALGSPQLSWVPLSLKVTVPNECFAHAMLLQLLNKTASFCRYPVRVGGPGGSLGFWRANKLAQDNSKHMPREFFKGENVSVLIQYFKSHDGVNTHKSERWCQANLWRSCPDQH